MTVHLGLPRQVFLDSCIFILVAFDVVVRDVDWETVYDVDDSTFQVVFGRQTVVGIVLGSVHGASDAIDQALVVAVE